MLISRWRDARGNRTAHLGGDLRGLDGGALVDVLLAAAEFSDLRFEVFVAQRRAFDVGQGCSQLRVQIFALGIELGALGFEQCLGLLTGCPGRLELGGGVGHQGFMRLGIGFEGLNASERFSELVVECLH